MRWPLETRAFSTRSILVAALVAALPLAARALEAPGADSSASKAPATGPAAPARAAKAQPSWERIQDRLTLRAPFNAARGKPRMIAFLSPTCPHCLNNVQEIQEYFLAPHPDADVAFFIVWVRALDTDSPEAIAAARKLIPDARVHHYWDDKRALNHWLLDAIMFDVNVRVYDVFLLYDRDALWEKRLPRPGFWLHQIRRAPGPWWNIDLFVKQVEKALRNEPFDVPY